MSGASTPASSPTSSPSSSLSSSPSGSPRGRVSRSGSLLRTRALRELQLQSQSEAANNNNNGGGGGGLDEDEPAKVEEVKKQLQDSVASYFDRLQEEEREKLKQEREERERKRRLPILLMVTLPEWVGGEEHEIILSHDCLIDEVKQTIWKQIPALWDTTKDDYDLTLAGSYVLDVEFCKLLSIKVVGNYFAEHNKVALSVIMKKIASKRAASSNKSIAMRRQLVEGATAAPPSPTLVNHPLSSSAQNVGATVRPTRPRGDDDDHKKRAAQIAQKLSESQGALYKMQTKIRELQGMYRKELDQCLSNIALTNVIRQADEAGLKKRTNEEAAAEALIAAEAESEANTMSETSELDVEHEGEEDEEDVPDDDEVLDDNEFAGGTVNEAELALRFFNDRKELLERIVANLQELLDAKETLTPSPVKPAIAQRQQSSKQLTFKSTDSVEMPPLPSRPPQTPLPPLPPHAINRAAAAAASGPMTAKALVRVSELMESEANQKDDPSLKPDGKDSVDEEEKERQRKRNLTPLERTREEFYETEESYVAGLAIIVKVYLAGVTGILSPNDLDTIFSNVATIYAIHKNLKQEISHIKDKECAQTGKSFGDSLKGFIPFLKMYTVYINAFDDANKRIGELVNTSKKFAAYLQEAQARPECKKLDLTSYLIMPVQRLPRYELLLRDLIRLTPPEDSEHPKLSSLLEAVVSVNRHVNESKKNAELRQKLYRLQVSIKDKVDIFSRVNRHLVREGAFFSYELRLQDQGKEMLADRDRFAAAAPHSPFHRDMRQTVEGISLLNVSLKKLTFKEHYFFLFDDYLLEVSLPTKSGKYKFIRKVELRTLSSAVSWEKDKEQELKDLFPQRPVLNNAETPNLSNEIMMLSPAIAEDEDKLVLSVVDGSRKRYLYKYKSTAERDEWNDTINKQVKICKADSAVSVAPETEVVGDRGASSPLTNLLGFSPASMLTPREANRPKKKKVKSKSKRAIASSASSLVTAKKKRPEAQTPAGEVTTAPGSPSTPPKSVGSMSAEVAAIALSGSPDSVRRERSGAPPSVVRSTSSLAISSKEMVTTKDKEKDKEKEKEMAKEMMKEKKEKKEKKERKEKKEKPESDKATGRTSRRSKSLGPARSKALLKEISREAGDLMLTSDGGGAVTSTAAQAAAGNSDAQRPERKIGGFMRRGALKLPVSPVAGGAAAPESAGGLAVPQQAAWAPVSPRSTPPAPGLGMLAVSSSVLEATKHRRRESTKERKRANTKSST